MAEQTAAVVVVTPSTSSDMPNPPKIDANAPIEERAEAEWNGNAEIRTEFSDKDAYIAYRKAEEQGRVKRYAPKAK